jgi:hypothetical protein
MILDIRRLCITLIALTAITGCTQDQPTPAPPHPTTTTNVTTTTVPQPARPTAAPPIARTLDIGRHEARPCDLLSAEQVANLGIPADPPARQGELRGICEWPVGAPSGSIRLHVVVKFDILNSAYQESNRRAGSQEEDPLIWRIFEPRTIGGQPAVVRAFSDGDGQCDVIVGAGQDQGFSLYIRAEGTSIGACSKGEAMAERIVMNLAG